MRYINKCHTCSGALSPGINSTKNDEKSLNGYPCLSDFSEIEFSRTGNLFEISLTHKYSCHMGKFFFPMLCFEKKNSGIQLWKNVDSLHFKCNFNVPNFAIVALITSHQTKQLRIQENLQFQGSVFLEAEG